ncbi:MAG: transposase domain-containing protein [Deltaproteobacteria bacterium]|nr:transposase domain-containing protein [Deltaproteobacteria bacterium]
MGVDTPETVHPQKPVEYFGKEASANLYSLIETAKANGLEPYAYLRRVFEELPKAATLAEVELLLPHRIKLGPSPEVKS